MFFRFFIILISFVILGSSTILTPVSAADNGQENVLYKIELSNTNYKTVILKLYTAQKYSILPAPIKKSDTGYVLFLPNTTLNIKTTPSLTTLKGIVDDINFEYYPLLSQQNNGYTKILIKTSPDNEDVDLFIENQVYTVEKTTAPKIVKKEEPKNTVEQVEQAAPEKIVAAEEITPQEQEVEPKIEPKQQINCPVPEKITQYITKTVVVKDYSVGFTVILAVIGLYIAVLLIKKKKKYNGKLSGEFFNRTANFSENDYLLLFSEDENFIAAIYEKCREKSVNLHIATTNSGKLGFEDAIVNGQCKISEFNFSEFYTHRDFYKKLGQKPSGVIFDVAPKPQAALKVDFVTLKSHIDKNYTNIFLILGLILKDMENFEGFVIFTDSRTKQPGQSYSFNDAIYNSTQNAVLNFVENIKNNNPGKILYCLNDF